MSVTPYVSSEPYVIYKSSETDEYENNLNTGNINQLVKPNIIKVSETFKRSNGISYYPDDFLKFVKLSTSHSDCICVCGFNDSDEIFTKELKYFTWFPTPQPSAGSPSPSP